MTEYRKIRRKFAAEFRGCSCHGPYGVREIEHMYNSLGVSKLRKSRYVLGA